MNANIPINSYLTSREWYDHCREGVVKQIDHALTIHGMPTTNPVRGALELCEEAAEVAREALDITRTSTTSAMKPLMYEKMIYELDQVAAFAMCLRVSMEDELRKLTRGDENEW
jgi:hypothetical protein